MKSLIKLSFEISKKKKRPCICYLIQLPEIVQKKYLEILNSLSKHRYLELGFPHNTPIADGGQIKLSANIGQLKME